MDTTPRCGSLENFMETSCRQETEYLISRGLRVRGIRLNVCVDGLWICEHEAGAFRLSLMPGNRRVLISHSVTIYPAYRGKGIGRKYLKLREEIAREAGINLLLATVRNDNLAETHLLQSEGWKKLTDRNTGVSLWGKELE